MTVTVANVGGTMTGGSDVVLRYGGNPLAGKASFTTPDHTRLTPRTVDFLTAAAVTTPKDPGVARGGFKITYGNRVSSAECCDVQQGVVIIDVGVRWHLNQPESLVDGGLSLLKSLTFNAAFIDAIKKGTLPS